MLCYTLASNTADLKAATEIREDVQADIAQTEADLVDTVDSRERAFGILERELAKDCVQDPERGARGLLRALRDYKDSANAVMATRTRTWPRRKWPRPPLM